MNTEEESGDQCSKVEDKIDHETKEESLEPHVNLPAKSLEDGSGDHFSPSKVQPTLAADIPDDVTKNLTEGISETKKDIEIGDGDHKKDITDTDVPQESPNVKISDTLKICDKPVQSEADDNDSCNFEEDFIALIKPTEGSVSEDVDSENQDEELVLKWDDDDEDGSITSLKDDEIVKNLDTESTDVTKAECVENADIDNSETAIAKDIDLIESVELQSSKDDELIVVTNAKASENVDMMLSTKTSEDDLIESSEPKTSEDDDLIESGTSEDDDFIESGDPKISKDDDLIESIEPKSSEGDDFIESIEPKASEDDDLIESSETKTSEDDDDLLSEIDAQIAELGASISKAENEKLMNIEKSKESTLPGNNEDNTETTVSALQEAISHESNVRTAEVDLTNEKQDHLSTYDTVTSVIKIDEIEDKPDDLKMEVEEALLKNDNDDIQTEIYKTKLQSPKADSSINQMKVDSSNKTEDVAENTEKDSDIEMEIDNSANLEDPNLTLDLNQEENLTKNVDILANSTKLDNSSVNELETSGNDTFVHDSSSSIEDITHGVNKPNIMLEIPTQELIDFDETVLSQDKETATDEHRNENISVDLADDKNFANETDEARDIDSIEKSKNSVLEKQSDDKGIEEKLILKVTEQNALKTTSDRKEISPEGLPKTDDTSADDSKTKSDVIPSQDIEKSDRPLPTEDCINEEIETKKSDNKSPSSTKSDDAKDENVIQDGSSLPKDDTTVRDEDTAKDTLIHLPVDTVKSTNAIDQKYGDSLLVNIYASKKDDINKDLVDVQPSTSQMALQPTPEPSDDAAEVTEATDSLGLLAESSRVRDEQDEEDVDPDADDQESSEHDDNDDDFDPDDESSNQQTAEHSEDSAQHSESETPKPQDIEKDTETNKPFCLLDSINEETGETGAGEIDKEDVNKDKEFGIEISNVVTEDDKESDGDMDIDDEIVLEEVEVSSVVVGDTETATEEVDMTALQDKVDDSTKEQVPAPAEIPFKVHTESKLRQLLRQGAPDDITVSPAKKKLEISQPKHVVSIVDLESSSEDEGVAKPLSELKEQTSINISKEIDVMSSGDTISDIVSKEDETVITVPRSPALKKLASRLNTSELTIKTKPSTTESTLVIPETKMGAPTASKFGGLEVFNLDSDEEDSPAPPPREPTPEPEPEKPRSKCINSLCISDSSVPFYPANPSTAAYYESRKKKRPMVCEICLYSQVQRSQKLVEGIKNYTPLLQLEEVRCSQELVEISDSDSDEEAAHDPHAADKIGDQAGVLERQLADMINATWERFQMDARLKDAEDELALDLERLEKESVEVNQMLDECQVATDKLRIELYATFEVQRHQLPGLIVYDTPDRTYICPEAQVQNEVQNKRRLSSASESQAKKPAIPLGPATDKPDTPTVKTEEPKAEPVPSADSKIDDDKDISVVTLSAEVAPADLPPPGDIVRDPLQVGQVIYAMRHAFGSWFKASVLEVTPKGTSPTAQNFTMCRVKFENKSSRIAYKLLPARCLAYYEPANVRMTIGTRVIALFKDTSADKSGKRESYYSGVVAEVPNPVNKYRYLVFFDDGYAQYVAHADTRLVCEFAALVWEEVHPFSREFVREYLLAYPERPMVRLHTGQSLKTEWNGKWWLSRVVQVDASLAQVYFEQDKRTEWIYRGSTRLAPLYLELQAAEKHRARPLPRNRAQIKLNMPYVEYTRLDEQAPEPTKADAINKAQQEEIRRQRSVAKKSTMPQNLPPQQPTAGNLDAVTSRVVYYTPKNAVKPYKMTSHTCGPKCRRIDVLALKDLRTYNPLAKPLLSGWERQIVRYKGHKEVMYRAPCGRRLRTMAELHRYLRTVNSDMGVDLFDFGPNTHCLAEFVLNKCIVGKKDLSHGKENVPVPCVNYYDESLPEFCSYNTERTPTAGVPLNLDPEFLCGCDCTDDCQDKSKCACWKMTQEGARTIGLDPRRVGYVYKRLPEPLPSGIYECNVRCKCRSTCLNRVAQHPLQLKLQVFKTLNRGWGIRSLNDVPKGSFLCIYAGNLLTDATANLDGLNEGDEYLAELDFIEVVEQMKEGYEDDIPDRDKKLDRENQESDSEETESEEEAANSKSDAEDGDFEPGYIPGVISGFNKRLRKRDKKKKDKELREKEAKKEMGEDDCITISDDEELREPSSFAAQAGMGGQFISKYRSVRTLFGKDEACYIMDAKVQGNIGRYLNHSCSPNVFVQNVFVDTHDPRFPWVAFFALAHIRAGTELTWNYNYDVGSVPGKALYCYCGAPNCRGRLL